MTGIRRSTLTILSAAAIAGGFWQQPARADCMENAQTQTAMNQCAAEALKAADAELNVVYRKLQDAYAGDQAFLAKLKLAQRTWIAFRDAELAVKYPAADKRRDYGSIYPMCSSQYASGLTRKRIAQLKVWLDGVPEGDACAGSVRVAPE